MSALVLRPIARDEANRVIAAWHRHHKPVRSHRFAIAAWVLEELVGVVVVGNPSARALQDGVTFEVTRLCTNGHRYAASRLLGGAWRAARAMGVVRLVSYTRARRGGHLLPSSELAAGEARARRGLEPREQGRPVPAGAVRADDGDRRPGALGDRGMSARLCYEHGCHRPADSGFGSCTRHRELARERYRPRVIRERRGRPTGPTRRPPHCGWCGETGHYQPTCPLAAAARQAPPVANR